MGKPQDNARNALQIAYHAQVTLAQNAQMDMTMKLTIAGKLIKQNAVSA